MTDTKLTLGIWDGHDAGAAIVDCNGKIVAAVNEERLSRKKLETGFPARSIEACIEIAGTSGGDITNVAFSTTDWAKTAARLFPRIGSSYYNFRRRKIDKPSFTRQRRDLKYLSTLHKDPGFLAPLGRQHIRNRLSKMGIYPAKIESFDHHAAHAATAFFPSGMKSALCITMDGVGDGLSATVSFCEGGKIERLSAIPAKDSVGIFFEQATTILGMRELEDEGKVMSLADYSHKTENKMKGLFSVDGLKIKAKLSPLLQYSFLEKLAWRTPPEDFAKMVQDTLEETILSLFRNAVKETGAKRVCWSGGIASNIKLNQRIRQELSPKDWFVFPHMGDGGLAAGAALLSAGVPLARKMEGAYFGPKDSKEAVLSAVRLAGGLVATEERNWEGKAADILSDEEDFFFLFQGRMEYGPRALGNRSIVAPADSLPVKNKLNLQIKERNWYQPFCPSILEREAQSLFSDYDGTPDRFMTMGYSCTEKGEKRISAATHIDKTARPQMVSGKENSNYFRLISKVKKRTGVGAVLNTSFNYHGDPIVCRIGEAIEMMKRTKTRHMFAEGIHLELSSKAVQGGARKAK